MSGEVVARLQIHDKAIKDLQNTLTRLRALIDGIDNRLSDVEAQLIDWDKDDE